jgi:hypothetical protein
MRVIGDADRTRFVVDLERNPDFGVLRLTNPYRLVIDMPDVDFTEPAKPGDGRGLISDYRYGLIAPGKARIVLDLVGPVEIVNTFVLDPVPPEPARLVVDVVPTTGAGVRNGSRARPRQARCGRTASRFHAPGRFGPAGGRHRPRARRHRFRGDRQGRPPGKGRHAGSSAWSLRVSSRPARKSNRC